MRRLWLWYLPFALAVLFSGLFAWGFFLGVRGDAGSAVNLSVPTHQSAAHRGPIRILVLGDSLARGAGDQSGLGIGGRLDAELKRLNVPHQPVVNLAVNGARTADLLQQLSAENVRRIVGESDLIVLSIGGNDLFGLAAAQNPNHQPIPTDSDAVLGEVEIKVAKVVAEIRAINPGGRLALIGLYDPFAWRPYGAITTRAVLEWNSRLLHHFSSDRNLTLVPTFDLFAHHEERLSFDHFHPGESGYALIARRVAEAY